MRDHPILTTEAEWRIRRMDDQCSCVYQALLLLEHLDPHTWAIQANATGITLYPRNQIHGITAWEKSLAQAPLPIPCEWIGYLTDSGLPMSERWKKYSSTSSHSANSSLTSRNSLREVGEDSSLTLLLALMQEYLCDGHPMAVKSMRDVCLSICKGISGN